MMSLAVESFLLANPNPASLRQRVSTSSLSSYATTSLRLRPDNKCRAAVAVSTKGLGDRFLFLGPRRLCRSSTVAFAASPGESSEVEVEKEEHLGGEDSQEAWKQTLESFKEQAMKMQSISQEAYEVYSKKAMVILKETSDKLKVQADKARHDLSILAKEISEDGKEYLSTAAEKSPGPVKEIVETFSSSTEELNEISKVYDFYLGIPYGLILSVGGFLSFMLTGSISAIRFGVILGGTLLALSIYSLRSYRKGQSDALALKGQTAVAGILFLRELRLLFQGPTILGYFTTFISGVVVAFYVYRIRLQGTLGHSTDLDPGTEKNTDLDLGEEN